MTHLETEIREVETRLAAQRAAYRREFDEYKDRLREQATSFTSLGVLVAVGFVAGSLLRARPAGGANGGSAAGITSLLASVIPLVAPSVARSVARFREERRRSAPEQGPIGRPFSSDGFLGVGQSRGGGAT